MCYRPATTVTVVSVLECGAFNKPTNETCQKCGADLAASKAAASQGEAPAPAAPKEISLEAKGLDNAPQSARGSRRPQGAERTQASGELNVPNPAAYSACFRTGRGAHAQL